MHIIMMRNHDNTIKQTNDTKEYAVCGCVYKNCTIHETKNQTNIYDYQLNRAIARSLESYADEMHINRHTIDRPTKTTPDQYSENISKR